MFRDAASLLQQASFSIACATPLAARVLGLRHVGTRNTAESPDYSAVMKKSVEVAQEAAASPAPGEVGMTTGLNHKYSVVSRRPANCGNMRLGVIGTARMRV